MLSLASTTVPSAVFTVTNCDGLGMLAAGVTGNAGKDLLGIAVHQAHASASVQFHRPR